MLSDIARTLVDVAAKRDDSSLDDLAAAMRAGKLPTSSNEHSSMTNSRNQHEEGGSSGTPLVQRNESSTDFRESVDPDSVSIDTAAALSLCGVQLDESCNVPESDTVLSDIEEPQVLSTQSESCPQECNRSFPVNEEKDDYSMHYDRESVDSIEAKEETPTLHKESTIAISCTTNSQESGTTFQQDEVLSISARLTSHDEVECIPPKREEEASSCQYNPTRRSNPDPYHGWDRLLTELRSSGRILNDNSLCSYDSSNFQESGD